MEDRVTSGEEPLSLDLLLRLIVIISEGSVEK